MSESYGLYQFHQYKPKPKVFRELKPGTVPDNRYGNLPYPPREVIVAPGVVGFAVTPAQCRVCGEQFFFAAVPYVVDVVCGQCERRQ